MEIKADIAGLKETLKSVSKIRDMEIVKGYKVIDEEAEDENQND